MMQLAVNEFLKFVCRFTLFGLNARLDQQVVCIDAGLLQSEAKAVVLSHESMLGGAHKVVRLRLRKQITEASILSGQGVAPAERRAVQNRDGEDLQRSYPDHVLQLGDHLLDLKRLAEISALSRLIFFADYNLTGNENDFDCRPSRMHSVGQLQAVHAPRHLDVGEQELNV